MNKPVQSLLFPLSYRTRQEFAHHLGMSYDTLKRRIKRYRPDIPARCLLSPDDQRQLLRQLGFSRLLERHDA